MGEIIRGLRNKTILNVIDNETDECSGIIYTQKKRGKKNEDKSYR